MMPMGGGDDDSDDSDDDDGEQLTDEQLAMKLQMEE